MKPSAKRRDGEWLLAVDHVQIAAPPGSEDRARMFYGELLSLTETPKPAALAARGGCWFSNGSVELHVGIESDFHAAQKAHPAFVTAELAALRSRLEHAGVEVIEGETIAGRARFHAFDPWGNRLEFIEPGSARSPETHEEQPAT